MSPILKDVTLSFWARQFQKYVYNGTHGEIMNLDVCMAQNIVWWSSTHKDGLESTECACLLPLWPWVAMPCLSIVFWHHNWLAAQHRVALLHAISMWLATVCVQYFKNRTNSERFRSSLAGTMHKLVTSHRESCLWNWSATKTVICTKRKAATYEKNGAFFATELWTKITSKVSQFLNKTGHTL